MQRRQFLTAITLMTATPRSRAEESRKQFLLLSAGEARSMAAAFRDQAKAIATLGMHEQRLSHQFERTLKQLREVQAERRENEGRDRRCAAALMENYKEEGITNQPAEPGFVFSNQEIDSLPPAFPSLTEPRPKSATSCARHEDREALNHVVAENTRLTRVPHGEEAVVR